MVPGRRPDFQPWAWGMLNASAQQPGFPEGGVLVHGEAEWHVGYRFASEGTVRDWEDSTARAQWDVQAADFARQTGHRSMRGSKVWFDSQTATPKTPLHRLSGNCGL
jgi:antibiotic biosynthesis monooxygenase (ABM) superfamily enzyme